MKRRGMVVGSSLAACMLLVGMSSLAAATASETDTAFVGKVSQGGRYEVEASKVAEERAQSPAVKKLAMTEVHDHEGVNARLMAISKQDGVSIAPKLNDEFEARLEKLKSAPAGSFDAAYVDDMTSIHDKDEKLFAQEAEDGTGAFKPFAAHTDGIVKRHIAALRNVQQ